MSVRGILIDEAEQGWGSTSHMVVDCLLNLPTIPTKKSHKIVHDIAKPRQPLLDDSSINKGIPYS